MSKLGLLVAVAVALLALVLDAQLGTAQSGQQQQQPTTGLYLPVVMQPPPTATATATVPATATAPAGTATRTPTQRPFVLSAQAVIDRFIAAGLSVEDVHPEPPGSFLPRTYKDRLVFTIDEVAPDGGQVFTCDTRANCDVLYDYFDGFRRLVGPHLYRSKNGRTLAQLNSDLSSATGAEFKAVIDALP